MSKSLLCSPFQSFIHQLAAVPVQTSQSSTRCRATVPPAASVLFVTFPTVAQQPLTALPVLDSHPAVSARPPAFSARSDPLTSSPFTFPIHRSPTCLSANATARATRPPRIAFNNRLVSAPAVLPLHRRAFTGSQPRSSQRLPPVARHPASHTLPHTLPVRCQQRRTCTDAPQAHFRTRKASRRKHL